MKYGLLIGLTVISATFRLNNLMLFLDENPDLKEEFEELNSFNLKPPHKSFPHKEILKKSISDLSLSQFEYPVCCISRK